MASKTNKPEAPTTANKRLQLNLRLDGREDLLEAIKTTAETKGLSVNAWVVGLLESATGIKPASAAPTGGDLESTIAPLLDKLLAEKLASFEERLGKLSAAREGNDESLRLELQADVGWVEQELNEVRGDCRVLPSERDEARADYALLLESSTAVADNLREDIRQLRSQLATERASREEVEAQLSDLKEELATLATDREELAQLKKQASEAAEEVHRSGRSIELEKVSGQQELSDAKSELKDAQATILKQGDKIRELERGDSFKPNPVESALRLEIGNLQAELEAYKQQQPATELELLEPAELLNQLKTRRKKSTTTLADVEKILEILEEGSNEPD